MCLEQQLMSVVRCNGNVQAAAGGVVLQCKWFMQGVA